jgi:rod shape-determining protein MreD
MQIGGVQPDLVLILVIAWTILRDLEEGLTWALIGGVSLDLISGAPFGVFSLALVVAALAANLSHGRIFGSNIVVPLGFTFPLSVLFNVLVLLFLSLLGRPVIWTDVFSNVLLSVALFNTAIMLVVFPVLYYFNRFLNPPQHPSF